MARPAFESDYSNAQTLQRAIELHRGNDLAQAEQLYRRVLEREPNHSDALHNLGLIALQTGHAADAVSLLRKAVTLAPSAGALSNLGMALHHSGQTAAAIDAFCAAIRVDPNFAIAHLNLGLRLADTNRLEEATEALLRAANLGNADAHVELATVLWRRNWISDSLNVARRAVALKPRDAAAHNALGLALAGMEQFDEAVSALRQAVQLDPSLRAAWVNLGKALWEGGDCAGSTAALRHAAALGPPNAELDGWLVFYLNYDPQLSPEEVFEAHVRWASVHAEPLRNQVAPHHNAPDPNRRLRIGYVSPDFRQQPVALFLEPLLEHADRNEVSLHLYCDVTRADHVTRRLQGLADRIDDVTALSDAELAQRVREDGIDLLVDVSGHTAQNRLLAYARQPAPVQVSYLGYPNTTGLRTVQYRLTDALCDPVGMTEHLHTETLVRLPQTAWCYRPPDNVTSPAPPPVESAAHITFGCFNTMAKLNDRVLRLWAEILKAVPDSRLLLKASALSQESARRIATESLVRCGISPQRVTLVGRDIDTGAHLARYAAVDIALDPYPYNGTTTTCEALWMGVPVITLVGPSHIARVGLSLLTSIGLSELAAESPGQYVQKAVELARDVPRLRELRATMRQRMAGSPLLAERRCAENYHAALREIWRAWCATKLRSTPSCS